MRTAEKINSDRQIALSILAGLYTKIKPVLTVMIKDLQELNARIAREVRALASKKEVK